jgi:hypothetical protein
MRYTVIKRTTELMLSHTWEKCDISITKNEFRIRTKMGKRNIQRNKNPYRIFPP